MASTDQAVVPVKSSFASKINWTNAISLVATAAAFFGLQLPPAELAAVLAGINAVGTIVTIVVKTFFTKSITVASAQKL